MDQEAYEKAMDYFRDIGDMFNDDKKYLQKAEKIESIREIDSEIGTDIRVYEVKYRLFFKDKSILHGSEDKAEKILKNHFGSLFALKDGGSQNVSIESIDGNKAEVVVRYCTEDVIFGR